MFGFIPDLMGSFWVGRRGVFLGEEECSNGVSMYDYPLIESLVDDVPSARLQEGSQLSSDYQSELREST